MTSRREAETVKSRLRFVTLLIAGALLGACATLPDDGPVVEQLDNDTGMTIARLGRPIELYRENFRPNAASKFAFLGPFETNLMGKREMFLWIALPLEEPENSTQPIVEVNGTALTLGSAGQSPDFAGLRGSPYKIPTPWIAMYYFKVDAALVAQLGAAQTLAIHMVENTKSGTVKTDYLAQVGGDPRLSTFAAR